MPASSATPHSHPVAATLAAGGVLALVSALLALGVTSLSPIALVLPLFAGVPVLLLILLPPFAFWLWAYHLFSGTAGVPARSFFGLLAIIVISAVWFTVGWRWGTHYQGHRYVVTMIAANVAVASGIWALGWRAERTQSFLLGLAFHMAVPLWLITVGLPYLGEYP